ncbi:hypothetical protein AB0J80_02215 [Actinoplanes sp. NPDC049548]|uniref:hypothetical protein n=1 Tax=Actinoplanes sp. NPDC049548 TaxID=3155152 RepID=UPI00342D9E45
MAGDLLDTGRPRSGLVRGLLAAVIWLAVVVPEVAIAEYLTDVVPVYPSIKDFALLLLPAALIVWLAPKVSYRRRDAVYFLLIWPYLMGIIAWRIALLPYRDWAPRDDEMAEARWHRNPSHAGFWWIPAGPAES